MNIAVVHNLPAGGQKRALYEQIKRLSQKHTIDLFTPFTANESYLPLKPFVRNHTIFPFRYYSKFPKSLYSIYIELPLMYQKMAKAIDEGGYDVVYVGSCFFTQSPYIFLYLKTPSVYFCPEPKREFYENIPRASNNLTYAITKPFRLPIKRIDQGNAQAATKVVTISEFAKSQVDRAYNVDSEINYLGVDGEKFIPQEEKRQNIVLSVGDFSLLKGHDFLIRSLSYIEKSKRPGLVIIGNEGIERNYLENQAKENEVDILTIENVSDSQLQKWYNRAKCFVHASHNEPLGLVVLEAASCGVPVVAVDEGGVGEILKTIPYLRSVPRDEVDFATAVEESLAIDEPLKVRMNLHNAIAKLWSWDSSVKRLEKIFENVKK